MTAVPSAVPGDHHTTTAADLDAIRERRAAYLRSHGHMGAFACCSAHASADDVPDLVAEVERLRAELAAAEKQYRDLNRALGETIDERDYAHDMADKLAYAIAPVETIGEHSSMNCPWTNALDHASELHAKLRAAQDEAKRLDSARAELADWQPAHAQRLTEAATAIRFLDRNDAPSARAVLLTQSVGGSTRLDRILPAACTCGAAPVHQHGCPAGQ